MDFYELKELALLSDYSVLRTIQYGIFIGSTQKNEGGDDYERQKNQYQ